MLDKNNRFNYGVDSGSGNAQNLSNLQNAYPSSRPSWLSTGVKGAVLGLGLATLLPLTMDAARPGTDVAYSDYPGPEGYQWEWPDATKVGGDYLNTVDVKWVPVQPVPAVTPPDGIHLTYGTPINDDLVLQGQITVTDKKGTPIDDPTAAGQFRFVIDQILYPIGGPYDVFTYYFLDKTKSDIRTDDYDGCQHQYLYVDPGVATLEWATPEAITYGTRLSDAQLNAYCPTIDAATKKPLTGTYVYDPKADTLLDAGTHTLTVTFTPDNPNYKSETGEDVLTAEVTLVVEPADLPVEFNPTLDTLTYGDTFTEKNISYTMPVPGTISAKEKATGDDMLNTQPPAGDHPLTLTFTPESKNYNPATADRTLVVKKKVPEIKWETPAPVEKGTALSADQLNAVCNTLNIEGTGYVEGSMDYTPTSGTVMDETQVLNATFTPVDTDNYDLGKATVTLEVYEKTPVILTWMTPDPITYGTPLALAMEMNQRGIKVDGIQLNALATTEDGTPVDGRYVYIPEEKNVLPVGTHKLKVTFTPTDTNKYKTVEYTDENGLNHSFVWLVVTKAALTITADSETIKYNEPAPTYTYQITSGALVGEDTIQVELNCDYIQGDADKGNVGTYDIVPSIDTNAAVGTTTANSVADNYDITLVNGTLTVEPADLSDNEFKLDYIDELTYGDVFTTDNIHTSGTVKGTITTDPVVDRIPNAGEYNLKLTFTPNTKNYNPKTVDGTLIVKKADPEITWEPASPITYGTPLGEEQLNATFKWIVDGKEVSLNIPGNTATYAPEDGKVLPAGPQTLKLVSFKAENGDSFRPGHPENYNEVKDVTREIVVEKADLTITIDNKSILFDEEAPDYTYTIDGFVNGDTVDSVFGKAPVATSDYVKGKPIGTYTITIDPAPTANNYNVKVVDGTLTVGVKEPDIIWIKPLPIIQGTPLGRDDGDLRGKLDPKGEVQLNALAVEDKNADPLVEITGTYVYTPAEGTDDLPLGENILSVTFTPDQKYADNYKAATAVVVLLVQAKPVIVWDSPQTITYGDPMGELFNAKLTVNGQVVDEKTLGRFVYKWAKSGNVIKPDAHTPLVGKYEKHLTVEFVLNESLTDYVQPDPVTVDLEVTKATPVIHWNDPKKPGKYSDPTEAGLVPPEPPVYQLPDITYGTELTDLEHLNAYVVGLKGKMTYTIPATMPPAGWNTLYVTFTPDETDTVSKNYDAVTVYNLIYVEYAELSDDDVTWVDAPFTVPYGTKLNVITHYTLTAEVDGKEIKGTVINKKMDGQDASEIKDAPAVGEYTLTATFDPDKNSEPSKNYKAKDKTTTFTVEKATPNIDLIEEDPQQPNTITIVYGTPIDDKFATETFIATNPVDSDVEVEGTYTSFDVYEQVEDATGGWSWKLIEGDLTQEYLDVVLDYNDPAPYQIVAHFTPTDEDSYENATSKRYDLFVIPADPTLKVDSIKYAYDPEKVLTKDDFVTSATGVDKEVVDGEFTIYLDGIELSQITTPLGKGTYVVTADFESANTNYNDGTVDADANVTVYVYGSVYIDWDPVTTIEFGTPLTKADQLNAVALDAEDLKTVVEGKMEYEVETKDGGKMPAEDGMVLPAGTYTLWAEFTPKDTTKYDPATQKVELVVTGKNPNVSWYPFPLFYGQTPGDGQYNARAEVGGQFDYYPPEQPVWPEEPGVYHLIAPFTPENPNYAESVAEGVLVIMKAPIRFEWPAEDLYYGETPTAEKQFNARVYSVATGEDITDKGKFEYPINELTDTTPVGIYTLVAPWTPIDEKDLKRYESGIAYANVEVLGGDPDDQLTWNPAALEYGKEAGDAQKNASSGTIAGHFEYPNMDGYNAGEYQVTANFISEDPNYTNGEVTATLKVTQAAPSIKFYKVVPAEEEGKDPTYEEIDEVTMAYGQIMKLNDDNTITITTEEEDDDSEVESASEFLTDTVISENNEEGDGEEEGEGEEEEESESEDLTIKVFVTGVDKKDVAGKVAFTLDGVKLPDLEQPLDPKEDPYKLKATFTSEDGNYANGDATVDVIVKVGEGDVDVDWDMPDLYPWSEGLVWGDFGNKNAVAWNAYTGEPLAWDDQLTYKYAPVDPDLVPEEDIDDMTLEEALEKLDLTEEDLIDFDLNEPANAGTYFLVAWYDDEVFGYGDDKDIIEIYQAEPELEVTNTVFTYGTKLYPESFGIYAYGTDGEPLTGDVAIYLDNTLVDNEGVTPEIGQYTLNVYFTPDNPNYVEAETTATVTVRATSDIVEVLWDVPGHITYGDVIELNAVAINTVNQEILAKDDELIYIINEEGMILPEGVVLDAGTYRVMAIFIGAGEYEGVEADTGWLPVTVEPAEPILSWKPAALVYGTPATAAQENATANVAGKFTYPDMSKLPVGKHEVTAKFISGDPNFANGEVSAILEVTKATPVISWATPAPITYGTALSGEQLNASANVSGDFEYTPAAGTELEIGTWTLTTVFTPKDTANYNTATASVELTVIPNVDVEIIWEPKTPITYGTPLSVDQLNATANIEGHFYYNPTYGTILPAGRQKLAVTFIPTERKYYKNQYMEVYIDVEKLEQTINFEPIGVTQEGDVIELNATTSADLPVRFVSSNEDVAVIQDNIMTIVGGGTAVITAIQDGNENYEAVSAEQTIEVDSELPFISIKKVGDKAVITFTGTLEESDDTVTWKPVLDAKGSIEVDFDVVSKKFYRSVKSVAVLSEEE